jgi:hypothetical protein
LFVVHGWRGALPLGIAVALGCGPATLGDDASGGLDSSGSETDTDPTVTTSVGPDPTVAPTTTVTTTPTTTIDPTGTPICPTFDLGSSVPNSVSSVVDDEVDLFSGSCGGAAVDAALSFTAPADGSYTFATAGTSYDTVLYVLDGLCDGPEIACNDDTADTSSSVTVTLFAGQTITVVIDGFSPGVSGAWHVDVSGGAGSCPDDDLGGALPFAIAGSTNGGGNAFASPCGGNDGQERRYLWTAPHSGVFTFDDDPSASSSVVYLLDGVCEGAAIACDAGVLDADSGVAGVVAPLGSGQSVTVVVDGAGEFELNIDEITGVCPAQDLGAVTPFEIFDDTFSYGNSGGRSCGGWFAPDATYVWSAPAAGSYRFAVQDAAFPWVLALHDAVCGGPELGCVDLFADGEAAPILLDLTAGQLVVVAVDGLGHQGGEFDLVIEPDLCPELDLGAVVPASDAGSLMGASPSASASCAPTQGGDVGYRFTAPLTAAYRFDTVGSAIDTVLSIRAQSCGGLELACDDDAGGNLASQIDIDMQAGDVVIVTVDGFDGELGGYQLHVASL